MKCITHTSVTGELLYYCGKCGSRSPGRIGYN